MRWGGWVCMGPTPSDKSVAWLRRKVGHPLVPGTVAPWPEVRARLNAVLRGWSTYFSFGDRYTFVAALRSVEIYAGVTGIVGRTLLLILPLKALQAGTGLQQRF